MGGEGISPEEGYTGQYERERRSLMHRRRFVKEGILGIGLFCLSAKGIAAGIRNENKNYHVHQFTDEGLAQFSYAVYDDTSILLIDPARDIQPYLDFAKAGNLRIIAVIETHPHADFVSGHAELQRRLRIPVYVGNRYQAKFAHKPLREGDRIILNSQVHLRVLDTPGHSPESISLILVDQTRDTSLFSGDTLLFGNVGRPDLRDTDGDPHSAREQLARDMYHTVQNKLIPLDDQLDLYPAHGAGSLCASGISDATSGTIGHERLHNPAFRIRNEEEFVSWILADLGFVPAYFTFDVHLNLKGAANLEERLSAIKILPANAALPEEALILDTRPQQYTASSYVKNAVLIPGEGKFETWLGTVILPGEKFYLLAESEDRLQQRLRQIAKIGYEGQVSGALRYDRKQEGPPQIVVNDVTTHPENYYIIDVRNENEVRKNRIFKHAINIPLPDLRRRIAEIKTDKPIVVHCASGYRSAIGTSLLRKARQDVVIYDFGPAIKNTKPQ
ncbi:MBL fold metallo-hydrolase [Sphingobacterium spiritivorum]|uniref:MBL fold metallo-hydrolase n=1 Tax=Sphingobacterium spiritivorum TaxID=258 RepID=UPI003DA59211